jgi:hypothetical protein
MITINDIATALVTVVIVQQATINQLGRRVRALEPPRPPETRSEKLRRKLWGNRARVT